MPEMDTIEKPHYAGHRKRLRERFLANGPEALADYEILEMILFPAKPVGDVKPMAKSLIAAFGSFGQVLMAPPLELMKVAGVGEAAVAAIKIAKAAAERLLKEEVADKPVIKSWTQLLDYCRIHFGYAQNEEFHVLFLDHKLRLLADERQQKGTVDHTPVYPREVVKRALEIGASSFILVHNHPSGDVQPSKADVEVTKQIAEAARPFSISVHDHLIIGPKKHFSFKSKGLI
ncbi:MAG: DNA repair protein RadC [Pseudomonadota bacterium]|nr:DNA repair protein RadC [Pseudomonadota bacterium]MDE3037579.1 DNA repair protein RadC [Pseudomonadota bacterium]